MYHQVHPSSPLGLPAHWETFSGFRCGMKVHTFLRESTPAFCSTGREQGVFVADGTAISSLSLFCYLFWVFFLLASPVRYKEILWKPSDERFVLITRAVCVPPLFEVVCRLWGPQKVPSSPWGGLSAPIWGGKSSFWALLQAEEEAREKCQGMDIALSPKCTYRKYPRF